MDWSCVDYLWIIVMLLSVAWTLILTAPIHCRGSIGEQVMECYNGKLFQICFNEETHLSTFWMIWHCSSHFKTSLSFSVRFFYIVLSFFPPNSTVLLFLFSLEYCSSLCTPSVSKSPYMLTVGEDLLPGISVIWTGERHFQCVLKKITLSVSLLEKPHF